jgi:uncharacterized YigZ family protein
LAASEAEPVHPVNEADPIMSDTYRTLAETATAEIKVVDSRFIADAFPVESVEAAEAQIESVRAREHQARHHCTAYRIGVEGDTFRYNDDGEPSGTAGPPILRHIDGRELTNTLVVVTRYFGGTKLGTGGLVRAYGDAADAVLDRATIVERIVRTPIRIRFDYADTTPANRVLRQFDTEVQARDFSDVTELTVGVRRSDVEAFQEAFTNALGGRGEVLGVGEEGKGERGKGEGENG